MIVRQRHDVAVWLERLLYVIAAIFAGRAIIHQNPPNFDMHLYAHRIGPMPFQARFLMSPVLLWAENNRFLMDWSALLKNSAHGPIELMLQIVDSLCLIALGWLTPRIRGSFSPRAIFPWLPRWMLLWIVAMVYIVRDEQSMYTPYDITALLLFNLAVYFSIRQNLPLYLATIAVAMFNREAVVFVLFVWITCVVSKSRVKAFAGAFITAIYWAYERWQVTQWLGRKPSESGSAWFINISMLKPHHIPQLLSVGGFLAIPLLFYRDRFQDKVFRRVCLGMVPWFLGALYFGWWNESRILGESGVLFAVSGAMLVEILAREKIREEPAV